MHRLAQNLVKEMDTRCQRWILVGNSLGGWVAAWIALDSPEKIQKLILVGSAGLKKETEQAALMLLNPSIESMKLFQSRAYFQSKPLSDHIWRAVVSYIRDSNIQ